MELHSFTLTFKLPDAADVDDVVERLAENCTDASVGIGIQGVVALAFDREDDSRELAVATATEDILKAVPGAVFLERRF
jgi:hypothetical protein